MPSVEQTPFRGYQSWAFSKVQLADGPMFGFGSVMAQAPLTGAKLPVQIQTLSFGPPVTLTVRATRRPSCAVGFSMIVPTGWASHDGLCIGPSGEVVSLPCRKQEDRIHAS